MKPTVPEFRFSEATFVLIVNALELASYRCVAFSETLLAPQGVAKPDF
ncbi:MAG: hypothetical protein DDT34_01706 [Firmicutes bacterium]|nr:hypothetical protein [Bacillota bacterium]